MKEGINRTANASRYLESPVAWFDIQAWKANFVTLARIKRRGRLAWTALVVYALVGFLPARGLVLCIGEGGHVALEAATALASCFDCPTENVEADSCCSDSEDQDSCCTCSDTLLQSDHSIRVRTVASDLLDLPPPACMSADPRLEAIASLTRDSDIHARWTSPPRPRVPTNLILRV